MLNLHVGTLRSLALQIYGAKLAEQKLKLLSRDQQALLMLEAFCLVKQRGELTYLNGVQPSLELGRLLSSDWSRLAETGKSFAAASPGDFRAEAKLRDLQRIEAQFEELLSARKAVPLSEVFRFASAEYRANQSLLPADTVILLPDGLAASLGERELVAALGDRVKSIGKQTPTRAPIAGNNQTAVSLFGAVGEANEIRNVLRICAENGLSLDEVEVCCTDPDSYGSLLFEEIAARSGENQGLGDDLPITFSQGLPCSYGRPGRALNSFATWIRDGFPQATLVRMLKEGLIELPQVNNSSCEDALRKFSMSQLSQQLARLAIGNRRERYIEQIELALQECVLARQHLAGDAETDDPRHTEKRQAAIQRRQQTLEILKAIVDGLLELTPETLETNPRGVTLAAQRFLTTFARSVNKLDRFSLNRLLEQVKAMDSWLQVASPFIPLNLLDWLTNLPQSCRVMGSSPRAGCLHVSGIFDGGASGRPNLFMVGLDDRRFPPGARQSPLFLDEESARVAQELPSSESIREEAVNHFHALVAETDAHIWCSYSALDLASNKAQFPSYVLLDLYRNVSEQPEAGQEQFVRQISPLASFAPQLEQQSLNRADWWLWRMTSSEKLSNAKELMLSEYPNLRAGETALLNRSSDQFTAHDGIVPKAGADLNPLQPEVISSASRLETAGTCPRKFLFKYGLGLEEPDQFESDPGTWLDPLQFGSFLHKVLEMYVSELVSQQTTIDSNENGGRLREILDQQLLEECQVTPPPTEEAFLKQRAELEYAIDQFLRMETRLCQNRNCRPIQVEAHLGLEAPPGNSGPLNSPEPIAIPCGDSEILLRGKIDRIDACQGDDATQIHIWDYKSGSAYAYSQTEPFNQGRRLQPYLYCEMVSRQLERNASEGQTVAGFGYVFPSKRGGGKRIEWTTDQLARGREALERIANLIRTGRFHATDDPKDCEYCEYRTICGSPETTAAQVLHKLGVLNATTSDFKQLRALT